ncbi:MAG: universal stress protein [Rhodothermales bacterium]
MLQIQRVLHATDFSPSAKNAMGFSLLLARLFKVPLDVLHVVPGVGAYRIEEFDETIAASDASLAERVEELRALTGGLSTDVRFIIGHGPLPGPVIIQEAHKTGMNFIVLGAHGEGEASDYMLGSVATDVIRRSTCPVLIVPPLVRPEAIDSDIERIVTFVSYAHLIEPVLGAAAYVANLFGSRLDVLAQVEGLDPDGPALDWDDTERNLRQIIERHRRRHEMKLDEENIHLHPVRGNAVDDTLAFVNEHEADLLIVQAPGLASMDSPSEQAVEELVGRSPCPVILINTCGQREDRSQRSANRKTRQPVT